ncbi:hypothetical protein NPIL_41371 [Nephila pilipes]|uniref:Uncharacterized protein n=1 Tax=Nephila pilipes TaxID=299642 RepID=A0A8X6Q8Z9_NEPPI|nr:hypothetical protein NPIL_41371 [Nephila pilipes]
MFFFSFLTGYGSPTPSGSTEARSVRNRIHFRYQSRCDNNLPTSLSRTNPFSYKSDDFRTRKRSNYPACTTPPVASAMALDRKDGDAFHTGKSLPRAYSRCHGDRRPRHRL